MVLGGDGGLEVADAEPGDGVQDGCRSTADSADGQVTVEGLCCDQRSLGGLNRFLGLVEFKEERSLLNQEPSAVGGLGCRGRLQNVDGVLCPVVGVGDAGLDDEAGVAFETVPGVGC